MTIRTVLTPPWELRIRCIQCARNPKDPRKLFGAAELNACECESSRLRSRAHRLSVQRDRTEKPERDALGRLHIERTPGVRQTRSTWRTECRLG